MILVTQMYTEYCSQRSPHGNYFEADREQTSDYTLVYCVTTTTSQNHKR